MRYSTLLTPMAALALAACSSSTSAIPAGAPGIAAGSVTLTTDKSVYSIAEVGVGTGQGVRATLVSSADHLYYARLGDAMIGAADQNPLYAAEGSDGTLERQSGTSWTKVAGALLVEGIREITIVPGKPYTVIANASGSIQPGIYRLRVSVRDSENAGANTTTVVSPSFEVR